MMNEKQHTAIRRRRSYSFRRLPRASTLRLVLFLLLLWDSINVTSIYASQSAALGLASVRRANTQRVYIAAQHWNSARLLRSHWSAALLTLVQELGIENVFVAIHESGSFDDTKDALWDLDAALDALDIQRDIRLSYVSHADAVNQPPAAHGWIRTPDGSTQLRRIPFLAGIRNALFEALAARAAQGEHFDTVLFLNDVVFSPADVRRLLDTNGGSYAAACALDFARPPAFYDTFALRDASGHEVVMATWPWFRARASRVAAERLQPVPVASCWNGMVAMPASSFVGPNALRFRAIPDSLAASHLEGSECCLIHADHALSATRGVFLNPLVRVGYNGSAYAAAQLPEAQLSLLQTYVAMWQSRVLRWTTTAALRGRKVRGRVETWGRGTGGEEAGGFCLVDEMHVLYDGGWKHV